MPAFSRDWPHLLVCAVGAVLLAAAVILASAWNTGRSKSPDWPANSLLQDPGAGFELVLARMHASEGQSLDGDISRIDAATSLDPLSGHPYLFHAFRQILHDGANPPVELLEIARKRNPRLREARLLLLDTYGRSGRSDEAIAEAQVLARLVTSNNQMLVRLVSGLIQQGKGLDPIADELARNRLAGPVLLRLAQQGASVDLIEESSAQLRGAAFVPRERGWISSLVARIAARPDLDGAARLWALYHDTVPDEVGRRIFDPEFSGGPGTPPFGWNLSPGNAGTSDFKSGWLEVYYFGKVRGRFASQLLRLPAGRYNLASVLVAEESSLSGGLAWEISCQGSNEPLFRERLEDLARGGSNQAGIFAVPEAGCMAQELQLVGIPGIRQQRQWASIESIMIEKLPE